MGKLLTFCLVSRLGVGRRGAGLSQSDDTFPPMGTATTKSESLPPSVCVCVCMFVCDRECVCVCVREREKVLPLAFFLHATLLIRGALSL